MDFIKNSFKYIVLLSLVFFTCCEKSSSYVEKANQVILKYDYKADELKKVLRFYSEDDPKKLKSAYLMISNLEKDVSWLKNNNIQKSIDFIQPYLKRKGKTEEVFKMFNNVLDSLGKSMNPTYEADIDVINSNILIENINLAFKAVELLPEDLKPSDSLFFDYVLPFKNGFEPLEPHLRKDLLNEYGWLHDIIKKNNTLESGVCALLDTLNLKLSANTIFESVPAVSQMNKLKFGACSDLVNLVVHILRALGIPATSDFTYHWGNHYAMGHDWLVFFSNGTEYAVDVYDYRQLNNIYEYASLPKVYRKNMNSDYNYNGIRCKDVTINYKKTNAGDVLLKLEKGVKDIDIGVFDSQSNWKMSNTPKKYSQNGFVFKNIGNEIIYMAESIMSTGEKKKSPFYLNQENKVRFLTPDKQKTINAIITRKYPPSNVRDNGWKESWIESLASTKIFGANKKDLSDTIKLYDFRNYKTYNPINMDIKNLKNYKYYLLKGPVGDRIHIAEFYPIAHGDEHVFSPKIDVTSNNKEDDLNITYISDDNSLTFLDAHSLEILFTFNEPTTVSHFRVQARNDDNNVKPGDTYELFYWDKSWQSLGRRVAKDTVLTYEDIPSNSVYWLRNYTEGKEEHVFLLDSFGKQYWPGVTNLEKRPENIWFCSK